MNLKDLNPNPTNPRIITKEAFEGLKYSVEKFGDISGLTFNRRTGQIVAGHQRREALLKLKNDVELSDIQEFKKPLEDGTVKLGRFYINGKVFNYREVDWDEQIEKEANIVANNPHISGNYDEILLTEYLEELKDLPDYETLLLDKLEPLDLSEPEVKEDEFDTTPPEEPKTILGDLYELNGHRLHCADSTSIDAVEKLMNGKKADMVFTDPPYGVSYSNNMNNKFEVIQNDDVFLDIFPVIYAVLKDNSHAYIWTSHSVYPIWREQFKEIYKSTVIWFKGGGGIGDLLGDYACDYEMALFCHKGRRELIGKREGLVWEIAKDNGASYMHPTQKPVALSGYALDKSSSRGDIVLDLFLGSGSTLIACEQTNRICYGQELDPKYCDVIVKRWVKYMQEKQKDFTVKLNGVEIDVAKHFTINEEVTA